MPKLPVFTPKKLIKILERFGFILDHQTGSHAVFYRVSDRRRVVVPMHTKDIPTGTLVAILRQADISKTDLTD